MLAQDAPQLTTSPARDPRCESAGYIKGQVTPTTRPPSPQYQNSLIPQLGGLDSVMHIKRLFTIPDTQQSAFLIIKATITCDVFQISCSGVKNGNMLI